MWPVFVYVSLYSGLQGQAGGRVSLALAMISLPQLTKKHLIQFSSLAREEVERVIAVCRGSRNARGDKSII